MPFITRNNAADQRSSFWGPTAGDTEFMNELGNDLRVAYRRVLHEPLPDALATLVRQLEDREQTG